MPTATLTSKGRTVTPKAIRNQLGLKPGDAIDFIVVENGDVLIRPTAIDVRALKGLLHRTGRKPISVEEMNRAIRLRKGKHS
ncbi:MAG: AbrB/MazE/SpoVT family DNA-binding domain-containing protein [Desulfobacterales bacterium]|nr:MAG: AbrB/MazE/SpoVT family DNA-binding domain-containing protein [Desulfobacterales bacterium]